MKQIIIAESVLQSVGKSQTLFDRGGIIIYPLRSAEEVITLHRTNRVNLIIVSHDMPEMGGIRLCSAIRSNDILRDVSLVLVCTENDAAVAECRQSGANDVIVEPLDAAELFSRIAELLVIPNRLAIRALLRVSVAGQRNGGLFPAVSQNISISGMLLETERRLAIGDRHTCSFSIGSHEITFDIVVMREFQSGEGQYQYGARFANPDTKSLIIIEQYVNGRISLR